MSVFILAFKGKCVYFLKVMWFFWLAECSTCLIPLLFVVYEYCLLALNRILATTSIITIMRALQINNKICF